MSEPSPKTQVITLRNADNFLRFCLSVGAFVALLAGWYWNSYVSTRVDAKVKVAIDSLKVEITKRDDRVTKLLSAMQRNQEFNLRVLAKSSPKAYAEVQKEEARLERRQKASMNWEAAGSECVLCDGL